MLEMTKAHQLIKSIDGVLSGIFKVVYHAGAWNAHIQQIAQTLLSGTVPWSWEKEWPGPEQAAAYLRELALRRLALGHWLERVEARQLLSRPLRLADLLQPATFLNALLQHTARTLGVAIDQLKLVSTFDAQRLPAQSVTVCVEAVWLQGAAFVEASSKLGPLPPNAATLTPLAPIYLAYLPKSEPECYSDDESVVVPLYYSMTREKLVCQLRLPCQGEAATWILAGVAAFLTDF
eukprot:TRINITY_DN6084_c0_g1_i3.p1 TRINITY_DN6084_c0_g1~~TRINITY_DN6084_c0_g1_i3.p1  ORF type:complete len:235 (-),score=70.87 TRINITY_DN6084_c0_g1_i3:314-1018(-)